MNITTIPVNGTWTVSFLHPENNQRCTIPAQVPGNVYGDLVRAGLMPDPYFGTNSLEFRPFEYVDWEYETFFEKPSIPPGHRVVLNFEGVDTIFSCMVNGQAAGRGENMFIPHSFDVTEFLQEGRNRLVVTVFSSVNAARKHDYSAICFAAPYNFEGLFIRRPMYSYG